MRFSTTEVRDLLVAWLALGFAFSVLFERVTPVTLGDVLGSSSFQADFAISLATVGVAFLLHELAHKVVAIHYDQVAEFRADFGMLALAVGGALVGFLFAAPGAVHHRGMLTPEENGHIALAGPVTNVVLAVAFVGLYPIAPPIAGRGVSINVLLAGFNMIPFGPLDGATVRQWDEAVWFVAAIPTIGLTLSMMLFGWPISLFGA
jgi:Zn-dependent protease